jgi:hypothetical protein
MVQAIDRPIPPLARDRSLQLDARLNVRVFLSSAPVGPVANQMVCWLATVYPRRNVAFRAELIGMRPAAEGSPAASAPGMGVDVDVVQAQRPHVTPTKDAERSDRFDKSSLDGGSRRLSM